MLVQGLHLVVIDEALQHPTLSVTQAYYSNGLWTAACDFAATFCTQLVTLGWDEWAARLEAEHNEHHICPAVCKWGLSAPVEPHLQLYSWMQETCMTTSTILEYVSFLPSNCEARGDNWPTSHSTGPNVQQSGQHCISSCGLLQQSWD